MIIRKKIFLSGGAILFVIAVFVIYAYSQTWGKTDLEIKIHINEKLVQESSFGESPTFAIWLENPGTGQTQTIYVTRRAAEGDWEGKSSVPVALPKWFEIYKNEDNGSKGVDAFTGATPKPGYFTAKAILPPNSKWICWIEVNLAGDFNNDYPENNTKQKTIDEYMSGQPALIYRAEITAVPGQTVHPEIYGMCLLNTLDGKIIQPIKGITTAKDIFDEISLNIVKPKPRIIRWYTSPAGKVSK